MKEMRKSACYHNIGPQVYALYTMQSKKAQTTCSFLLLTPLYEGS